jgi:GDPmannose 4,6-dehydratase
MWRMLQAGEPQTYVLATGRKESVRNFVRLAFRAVEIRIEFRGEGEAETGIDARSGRVLVRVNPSFYRPAEVDQLIGDASKAYRELGWKAETELGTLCDMMVVADLERNKRGASF